MSLPPLRSSRFTENRFRIRYAVLAVIVAIAVGTLGFHLIEGWSLLSSLYVATQTVTTVGYGDLSPQTPVGQVLASVVMIVGYGIIAVPTGIVTAELAQAARQRNITRQSCPSCAAEGHDPDALHCKYCGAIL